MRFIYTERLQIRFNETIENMELRGMTNKEIMSWVRTYRKWFGISDTDMEYITNYYRD
jgi:hypothetical protein